MKIEILDTTLRDGAQGAGVEFSSDDRLRVIHELDLLGVSYIEAGMITSSADAVFFSRLGEVQKQLENAKICVFCRTVKAGERAEDDELLTLCASAPVPAAVIYGKASLSQLTDVLGVTAEENLRMIGESVSCLVKSGKEVIFDAEHFFDGYSDNPTYATDVVNTAFSAGASRVILCDTNGGMLPDVIGLITRAMREKYDNIGIHCHNDMGMAVSCSLSAVLEGAMQVHGTIMGVGERCGNADLCTLIPVLQLKMGFDCIGGRIRNLTRVARSITDAANLTFDEKSPFIGGYAFTHKAGAHIDGVKKSPRSFEHISPESVGNSRNIVISGLSGRAALLDKLRAYMPDENFTKDDPRVVRLMASLKEREALGYDYEDSGASFALLIDEAFGNRREFFRLLSLKVMTDEADESYESDDGGSEEFHSSAVIKISVGGRDELTAGEGNGPVNAIDEAFRRALIRFYPEVGRMRLTDYRVRVLESRATASRVRVAIESTDGSKVWRTVGVSSDVINASWQALRDSVEYMLSEKYKS
ncbi:MAG: citramalate synthase [Eubacteriales bacterium]